MEGKKTPIATYTNTEHYKFIQMGRWAWACCSSKENFFWENIQLLIFKIVANK